MHETQGMIATVSVKRALTTALVVCALLFAAVPAVRANELASTSIVVREIKIEGPDIISHSLLDELLPRYTNKEVSAEDLLQLAQQLTVHLIEQGYVNSGVILPDQKVENGIVRLQVIAGHVNSIVVSGNRHLSDSYIASRLRSTDSGPFNINNAVRRLQLLQRNPRILKLNAELKPSVVRGTALLNVDVEEARAYGGSIGIDNHISPNVGTQEAVLDFYHLDLLGQGDAFTFDYRKAEGFSSASVAYGMPLNAHDTTIAVNYDRNTSKIVSQPFARLDIEGATTSYGAALRHPFVNTLQSELTLGIGLQKERVESFLLGEPFSFSASDQEGISQVTLVQLTQDWVNRSAARVIALRSSINVGIDALHASVGGEGDGRFLEWLLQSEWLQKFKWQGSTLGVKLQLHLSNDTLPAYRKYPLGGASSVRGYRENLSTRDNGFLASLEWAVPVGRLPVPWLSQNQSDGQLTLIPFVDYGHGWDYLKTASKPVDLASVGLGAQWRKGKNSSVDLQLAKALISRERPTYDRVLQDDGVHFSVRIGF